MEGAYNPNSNIGDSPHTLSTHPSNLEISQFAKFQENSHVPNFTPKNSTNQLTNHPDPNRIPNKDNNYPTLSAERPLKKIRPDLQIPKIFEIAIYTTTTAIHPK